MLRRRKPLYSVSVHSTQEPSRSQTVLGTAIFMLALFVVLYILVYVECLVRRWLRALALLIWACLMILGSVLVWDSWQKDVYAWEQVRVGADITGLGHQQLEHATSRQLLPTCGSGPWTWTNTACSSGLPCRRWCWLLDGLKLTLFSEEGSLGCLAFWIESVWLLTTKSRRQKGINVWCAGKS